MAAQQHILTTRSPDETADLAVRLGAFLRPGDCVLLSGEIGTGKSHFARSLIQSVLIEPEDVPSPTFTLVQTYDAHLGALWHADLYRLSDPDQVIELGLVDAFDDAICLVEWPDRLQDLAPRDALQLNLAMTDAAQERTLRFDWSGPKWDAMLSKVLP